MRVVILLASGCGLRIPALSVGSCEEYKDLYKITIYENEPEEYIVFSTSELKKEIISYLSMRKGLRRGHHPKVSLGIASNSTEETTLP